MVNLADAVEKLGSDAAVEKMSLTQGGFAKPGGSGRMQALLEKSASPFSRFRQSPGLSDHSHVLAGKSTAL